MLKIVILFVLLFVGDCQGGLMLGGGSKANFKHWPFVGRATYCLYDLPYSFAKDSNQCNHATGSFVTYKSKFFFLTAGHHFKIPIDRSSNIMYSSNKLFVQVISGTFYVAFGSSALSNMKHISIDTSRLAAKIMIPTQYLSFFKTDGKESTLGYDLAIVGLSVAEAQRIMTYGGQFLSLDKLATPQDCRTAGWGGISSTHLNTAQVSILGKQVCQEFYRKVYALKNLTMYTKYKEGNPICLDVKPNSFGTPYIESGDSGSPIVCGDDLNKKLFGMICARSFLGDKIIQGGPSALKVKELLVLM